jgi:hypothetical protein
MKIKSSQLAVILGLGALLGVPTIALAQTVPGDRVPTKPVPGQSPDNTLPAEPPVTVAVPGTPTPGQASYNSFIFALSNLDNQVANIASLDNLSIEDIKVVDASRLTSDNNTETLDQAIAQNVDDIRSLQNAVTTNKVLYKALVNSDIAIEDVVAINVLEDGNVIVFYQ